MRRQTIFGILCCCIFGLFFLFSQSSNPSPIMRMIFSCQAIYQHLDLQQNVFAVSLALEDLNRHSVEIQNSEKSGTGGDARNSSAR
jgi:hypothetical protein